MKHLIEIKSDVFNIAKRIKQINKNFIIYFNRQSLCFELYSKTIFKDKIFEANLGANLTSKAIKYVCENSIRNLENIIKSIDKHNEKLESNINQTSSENSKQMLKEMLDFADKNGGDVDFSK